MNCKQGIFDNPRPNKKFCSSICRARYNNKENPPQRIVIRILKRTNSPIRIPSDCVTVPNNAETTKNNAKNRDKIKLKPEWYY